MARQIVKALAMFLLIAGLTAGSAVVANGQSRPELIAQVPFDFVVVEKTLRAGEYDVRAINRSGEVIEIVSRDTRDHVLRLSYGAAATDDRARNARLVFHRYGGTYFLRQVWMSGESQGRELPATRQERAIQRELGAIAKYHGETKPVYEVVEVLAALR